MSRIFHAIDYHAAGLLLCCNRRIGQSSTWASVGRFRSRCFAARAGLIASQYAGHSLRSGFLTSAAEQRASIFKMQAQSRHKSLDVLSGYVRAHELFEDHAGAGLLTATKRDAGA